MYDTILNAIPNLWRNELRAINPVSAWIWGNFQIRLFYMLLLENFLEPPISKPLWIQHFPSMSFRSLYPVVNHCHFPPICVSLNYRVATNTIFTLIKLVRMGNAQDSTCLSCHTGPEDMLILRVTCPILVNFKSVLLTDKQHTIIDYQALILQFKKSRNWHKLFYLRCTNMYSMHLLTTKWTTHFILSLNTLMLTIR
jgi:hypothetical protein